MIEAFHISENKVFHTEDLGKISKQPDQILIKKDIHHSGRRGIFGSFDEALTDKKILANGIEIEWNSYSGYEKGDRFVLRVGGFEIPGTKRSFKDPSEYCPTLTKYISLSNNKVMEIYSNELSKKILSLKKEIETLKNEKDNLCADIIEIKEAISKISSVTQKNKA